MEWTVAECSWRLVIVRMSAAVVPYAYLATARSRKCRGRLRSCTVDQVLRWPGAADIYEYVTCGVLHHPKPNYSRLERGLLG